MKEKEFFFEDTSWFSGQRFKVCAYALDHALWIKINRRIFVIPVSPKGLGEENLVKVEKIESGMQGDPLLNPIDGASLSSLGSSSDRDLGKKKSETVRAKMPGKVTKVHVAEGDTVSRGQILVSLEAMKMEFTVLSGMDGKIRRVTVSQGSVVSMNQELLVITDT